MKLPDNFNFSQSSLQDYVQCHYRFYLRHLKRLAWPALQTDNALLLENHMLCGARFHRLVQQYFTGLPLERLNAAAAADPDSQIWQWWQDFLVFFLQEPQGRPSAELILLTRIDTQRLMAKFDLVLKHAKGVSIYDWKTNQRQFKITSLQKRLQTRVYLYTLASEYFSLVGEVRPAFEEMRMIYWQANFPDEPVILQYSESAYQADKAYLTHLIKEICSRDEDEFEKTNDLNQCRYCVYRSLCERGIEAGSYDAFEKETEGGGLDDFDIDMEHVMEFEI